MNDCKDPSTWDHWNRLIARHPDDMSLQALHALRIGLCQKVDKGNLTVEQATTIFETVRKALIEQQAQEKAN